MSFALSGTGQAAAAQLKLTPPLVSFGGTTVGGHLSSAATFRNVGGAPLTINAVHLPGRAVQRRRRAGSRQHDRRRRLGDGQLSHSIPPKTATSATSIGLETTGGNGAVGALRTAGAAGVAADHERNQRIRSRSAWAARLTKSFTVKNTGGTPVTITKSKPPAGGAFAATTTLAEGSDDRAGRNRHRDRRVHAHRTGLRERALGRSTATTRPGCTKSRFSGTGTVPAPGAAWSHNGSATIPSAASFARRLPPRNQAGSGFFNTPAGKPAPRSSNSTRRSDRAPAPTARR